MDDINQFVGTTTAAVAKERASLINDRHIENDLRGRDREAGINEELISNLP